MKKVWKKMFSVFLSICLAFSLLTGLDLADETVWAAGNGTLQNGELTASTDGWTFTGDIPAATTGTEEKGYRIDPDSAYLSIWTNEGQTGAFSMSQTISGMAAGSYTAKIASVGNGSQGASQSLNHLTLTVQNVTQGTQTESVIIPDGWDNWDAVTATEAIAVADGDTVTITISGNLEEKEWYGLKNLVFDVDTAVEAPITVQKVTGLSEDFIHGVDVSTYMSEIQSGVKYYDENGVEKNMFEIFRDAGVNYVRLRVWNCPFRVDENGDYLYVDDAGNEYTESQVTTAQDANGFNVYTLTDGGTTVYREGYGAGNCDIDAAVAMGKIATQYGMKVLIDFHYSDFWADPQKYKVPKAWEGMTIEEKTSALSAYTTESLNKLKDAGVDVGMVQIGNEINNGMAGEKSMDNICTLLKAGSQAVRSVDSNILIAVHYADPNKEGYQYGKAKALDDAGVDYDVFASSYYSFWHGTTSNLTSVLKSIATDFNKKVMVAEVSYCSTLEDGDGASNVVNAATSPLNYSIDEEGQAAAVRDAIAAVSAVGDAGIGTFYWEPAWIPVENYADAEDKSAVLASNIDKWQKYGSGWASRYSGSEGDNYDPGVDIDQSTHGSQWDNQAMFDFNGKALSSINVYKWVYTGTEGPVRVSTVDTLSYTMNYKDTPSLPAAVNVKLNDGNVVENVAVTWNAEKVEALKTADFGEYIIDGSLEAFSYDSKGETLNIAAGTYKTTCTVKVTGTNCITNGSFEDGDTGWTLTNTAGTGNPCIATDGSAGNAKDGKGYYTAWAEKPMDFTIEQTMTNVPASGKYTLFAYYQGTNVAEIAKEAGLFAQVTYKDGSVKNYSAEIQIPNVWKSFYQAKITGILVNRNVSSIKISTRMACTGSGSGAWVVVDDVNLMRADALTAEEEAYGAAADSGSGNTNSNTNSTNTDDSSTAASGNVKVKKISFAAKTYKIAAGKKVTLKPTVTPGNAKNKKIVWSTSNRKYATVSSKGVVTTKKAGAGKTVTITAKAADGSGVKAKVKIQIMKNAVTRITLKANNKTVKAGRKVTVKATVKTNGKKANKTLEWSTSNKKYATVSSKGVVTTKKAGKGKTVTITAKSTDGTNKKATIKIKIKK